MSSYFKLAESLVSPLQEPQVTPRAGAYLKKGSLNYSLFYKLSACKTLAKIDPVVAEISPNKQTKVLKIYF